MFAPTRTRGRLERTCSWSPINALYRGEGAAFGDGDLRPEILQRYFIPGDFYEPIYHTSTGPNGVGVLLLRPRPKRAGVRSCLPASPLQPSFSRREGVEQEYLYSSLLYALYPNHSRVPHCQEVESLVYEYIIQRVEVAGRKVPGIAAAGESPIVLVSDPSRS
ncbi:hypothetical protein KM043_016181 [Ampulex compressa]|nr:hypothetical protein KM043_016181 [Ampulex compressa]